MKVPFSLIRIILIFFLLALSLPLEARPHKKKQVPAPAQVPREDASTIKAPVHLVSFIPKTHAALQSATNARYTGRPEEALRTLQALAPANVPFAAHELLSGIVLYNQKRYAEALNWLGKAEKHAGLLTDYVRLYLARTLLALNRPQEALDQLVGIPKTGRLVERDLLKAKIKVLETLNRKPESIEIKLALKKSALPVFNLLSVPTAQEIYQKLSRKPDTSTEDLARAAYKARLYNDAARLFGDVWTKQGTLPVSGSSAEILSLWSSSLNRSGQTLKAIEVNLKLISLFPRTTEAWKAEEKIAYQYFDSAQFDKAHAAYTALIQKKKDVQENRWNLFWCDYLKGRHRDALNLLDVLGSDTDVTRYWRARVFEKTGETARARAIYITLSQGKSTNYYSWMAGQRLKGGLHPQTLVAGTANSGRDLLRDSLPFSLATTDPVSAAVALAAIGEYRYAYDESQRDSRDFKSARAPQIWALAGNYFRAYTGGMPYPRAYESLITMAAKSQGIEPALIWAVMRQESTFKPDVVSSSLAFGLMQIIPPTAHEIAKDLGEEPFAMEGLIDPPVSIRFGSRYLRTLMTHFGGNLPEAIAAYNAGPEAVDRWKKWGKLEADEFIELIPYEQTNHYVKKVLVNFWKYRSGI